jgi:uncharacterized protein involved in propanediol utilization
MDVHIVKRLTGSHVIVYKLVRAYQSLQMTFSLFPNELPRLWIVVLKNKRKCQY